MNLRKLYFEVDALLDAIDFNSLWHGFERFKFAIYDKEKVYFADREIPYDNRFLGNTSIEYENEYIAIWNGEDTASEDVEILASSIVHEMFHAYQRKEMESRYPNDLAMLDYLDNLDNHRMRHLENIMLAQAYKEKNICVKKEFLFNFMSIRKQREKLIGDMIKQEYYAETIEGIAEFIGSKALERISTDKYKQRMSEYINKICAANDMFFDIRRMAYFTGTILCAVLSDLGIRVDHDIRSAKESLYETAAKGEYRDSLEANYKQLTDKYNNEFEMFHKQHSEVVIGDFVICGYDPMNMIKLGRQILCKHFVMLLDQNSGEQIVIEGPVVLNLLRDTSNKIGSYIK